jgi:hypothetical protein
LNQRDAAFIPRSGQKVVSVRPQNLGLGMRVYLDKDLTLQLIHAIHGDLDQFTVAWEEKCQEKPEFPKAKQRSTIYRWIADGVPGVKETKVDWSVEKMDLNIFGICSLLDIDPFCIFDFKRNGYFSAFPIIRQAIYRGARALGGLSPIFEMFKPGDEWPSDQIAQVCYGRKWFVAHLTNAEDWENLNYILVKAKFTRHPENSPRAVHISYRRTIASDTMWRYYGLVVLKGTKLRLYNESGGYQEMDAENCDEIRFRTYYGGRPVIWRIASLHEFTVSTEYPFNDSTVIGFKW